MTLSRRISNPEKLAAFLADPPFPFDVSVDPSVRWFIAGGVAHTYTGCGGLSSKSTTFVPATGPPTSPPAPACEQCFGQAVDRIHHQAALVVDRVTAGKRKLASASIKRTLTAKLQDLAFAHSWIVGAKPYSSRGLLGAADTYIAEAEAHLDAARAKLDPVEVDRVLNQLVALDLGEAGFPSSHGLDTAGPSTMTPVQSLFAPSIGKRRESFAAVVNRSGEELGKVLETTACDSTLRPAFAGRVITWANQAARQIEDLPCELAVVCAPTRSIYRGRGTAGLSAVLLFWYTPDLTMSFRVLPERVGRFLGAPHQGRALNPSAARDVAPLATVCGPPVASDTEEIYRTAAAMVAAGSDPAAALDYARLVLEPVG